MRKPFIGLALAALMTALVAMPAAAAPSASGRPTIVTRAIDINQQTGEFSTLLSLVTMYPDIVDALGGKEQLTVFAPTDAAFAKLFAVVNPATLTSAQIKDILLYHVTAGRRSADWLSDRSQITMLNGDVAMIDASMGVIVDGAKVLIPNVPASNGFIHAVDTVLLPPAYS
jgi:uncharacterized surface protein with fasciclin (FAS1) repeats